MLDIIFIAAMVALLFWFRDSDQYEAVYHGNESNLSEANEYYWLLKNHQIPFKYQIPYNWKNFYQFGYQESSVYIKVRKKDVAKATKLLMYYRADKLRMERNIEANKNGFRMK